MINYIPHNEIDKNKWDNCIKNAGNEFIYAYSWFLDIVSPSWDAIILDDYQAVMPLTWSVKWNIKYLFPPLFTQQLGIFSADMPSSELIGQFIAAIPDKFKLVQIKLNEYNIIDSNIKFKLHDNHQIDLSKAYEKLYNSFNRNCKRNINKARACKLEIRSDITPKTFTLFVKKHLEHELKQLGIKEFITLEKLIAELQKREAGEIYGAYTHAGELCGVALHLITRYRCIFSVCASSKTGKQCHAMYLLVSSQIKKYAGSGKIFDFSGSNIPGIAYFNSTFGSEIKTYPSITINRLPWPFKLLKK